MGDQRPPLRLSGDALSVVGHDVVVEEPAVRVILPEVSVDLLYDW